MGRLPVGRSRARRSSFGCDRRAPRGCEWFWSLRVTRTTRNLAAGRAPIGPVGWCRHRCSRRRSCPDGSCCSGPCLSWCSVSILIADSREEDAHSHRSGRHSVVFRPAAVVPDALTCGRPLRSPAVVVAVEVRAGGAPPSGGSRRGSRGPALRWLSGRDAPLRGLTPDVVAGPAAFIRRPPQQETAT